MKRKKDKRRSHAEAQKCPHCGKLLKESKADRPKKWHEKTSVTLCIAAGLALFGLGFIHVIVGVVSPFELPFDVVLKESFGYRETLVNAERIKAIPYMAAKIRYPRGCKALQQKGYLDSGRVFETRMSGRLKEDMRRWQAEFEEGLGKPKQRWQDRLRGKTNIDGRDPEDANSCNNHGIASAERGQYETAISDFTRACRRNPVFAEAYFNRGLVYVAIGQLGKATADFGKAIEIRPQFTQSHVERGLIHADMGRHDQAIADFTKTVEVDPARAEIYFRRSLVCCSNGKYDQAWKDVHKIESLGLVAPTGYLGYLRAASERQK